MVVVAVAAALGGRELEMWRGRNGACERGEYGRVNLEIGFGDLVEEGQREAFEKDEVGGAMAAIGERLGMQRMN